MLEGTPPTHPAPTSPAADLLVYYQHSCAARVIGFQPTEESQLHWEVRVSKVETLLFLSVTTPGRHLWAPRADGV